jgi:hypothetical protein
VSGATRHRITHRRSLFVSALLLYACTGAVRAQLPLEPQRDAGQSVSPAFEGWFKNADGTFTLLVGYFNRNRKETLDIPVGPDNRIEPGGPDYGQPTHFLPRRNWGVFAIKVPADFGDRKLTWTITANGKPVSIPLGLTKDYQIEPFRDAAQGNTPPALRLSPDGPAHQGPPAGYAASLTATVGEPLPLTVWAADDGVVDPNRKTPEWPVSVTWFKHRGPGNVTFAPAKPEIDRTDGKATSTATFEVPGEYVLRAQANDVSGEGGGGFQCCWTNAHIRVSVRSATKTVSHKDD